MSRIDLGSRPPQMIMQRPNKENSADAAVTQSNRAGAHDAAEAPGRNSCCSRSAFRCATRPRSAEAQAAAARAGLPTAHGRPRIIGAPSDLRDSGHTAEHPGTHWHRPIKNSRWHQTAVQSCTPGGPIPRCRPAAQVASRPIVARTEVSLWGYDTGPSTRTWIVIDGVRIVTGIDGGGGAISTYNDRVRHRQTSHNTKTPIRKVITGPPPRCDEPTPFVSADRTRRPFSSVQ